MEVPKKWKINTDVDCTISFVFFKVHIDCKSPSLFFRKELMHRINDRLFLLKHTIGRFGEKNPEYQNSELPIDEEFTDLCFELHQYDEKNNELRYVPGEGKQSPYFEYKATGKIAISQWDTSFSWGYKEYSCSVQRIFTVDLSSEELKAVKEHFPDLFEEIKPTLVPWLDTKEGYGDLLTLRSNILEVRTHHTEHNRVYLKVKSLTGDNPFLIYINKESNKLYLGADMLDVIHNVEKELFHWLHECFDFETGKATDFFDEEINEKGWA